MSRTGPMAQLGLRGLRRQTDDQPAQPVTQPSPHWPPQYGEQPGQRAPAGQQPSQGYYFPQSGADAPAQQGFAQPAGQQPGAQASVHPLPFNRYPAGSEAPQASSQQLPFNRFGQGGGADRDPNFGFGSRAPQEQGYDYSGSGGHQPGSAGPAWGQPADGRGYDLGSYGPGQGQQPYGQQDPGIFDGQQDPPPFGAAHGYGETDNEYDESLGEEEDEPRRGRRGLMIVAALVGAIGLGGGMAYGYKLLFPSRTGPIAVIKDTQGPVKFKPEVADGKGFAHTDKKLVNRLGDDTGPSRPAAAESSDERAGDPPNAPRRVPVIHIPTGGGQPPVQAVPATAQQPAAAPAPAPLVGLPGVMLENMGPPPGARAQMAPQQPPGAARAQMPPPAAAAPARPAQQPPVRIAAATGAPPVADAAEPARVPVAKSPVAKSPVAKPKEAGAPAAAPSSGSGYVAVLSSQKSRMDALKIFANMQEKYGDVLASRTPDVQEANLGEKGVWYRLVVGPPGSRDAASGVCSQLKTAGYNGCWVTAY
jgi:hypothetical protein